MKKQLSVLLALFLIFVCLPFAEADGLLEPPSAGSAAEEKTDNDTFFTFSFSAPDALMTENLRRETYETVSAKYTDAEIAADKDASWLLCPIEVMCGILTEDMREFDIKSVNVTEGGFRLSLFGDILPEIVKNNEDAYFDGLCDGFSFTFSIKLVLNENGIRKNLSDPADIPGKFTVPPTSYIEYDIPFDADNTGNPVFLFYPNAETVLKYPTRSGFTFTGWVNENGTAVDRVPALTRHIKIGAGWESKIFRVNYILTTRQGADFIKCRNTNPDSFSSETGLILTDPAAPSGWVFLGWHMAVDLSDAPIKEIPAGTAHAVDLYAQWKTEAELLNEKIEAGHWGDLDSDGKITAADARIALRSSVGLETLSAEILARGDFASQGRLTASAARTILRLSVGLDELESILKLYGII